MKEHYLHLINQRLEALLTLPEQPQKILMEAARYSTLGAGKRLRPLLLLSVLEGYNVPIEHGLDIACALELVHTYSLIHDDLPCMDNDDMRRGLPTLHKVYPEGLAVLAGDFLLTYAFEVIANAPHLSDKQRLSIIHLLSKRSGFEGMIGGQVMDINAHTLCKDVHSFYLMHSYKTAALFVASLDAGGIIAQASPADLALLQRCGESLGIAFQMIDDLHDLDAKPSSAVTLMGKDAVEKSAEHLLTDSFRLASSLSKRCLLLEQLMREVALLNEFLSL